MFMYDLINIDDTSKHAFKALAEAMNTSKNSTLCYLYAEYDMSVLMYITVNHCVYYQVSKPMTEVCKEFPTRNSPRIAACHSGRIVSTVLRACGADGPL